MPLIGRIRDEATSTLTEAKMIKSERGPVELKKMVDKLLKKAAKADKQELARMSTYEIFTTFVYLLNSDNFSYEETMNYCEETKKTVSAWTFDKDSRRLDIMDSKTNEDGSLNDWTAVNTMTELGLTPIFVNYNMKLVYIAMYHFLKLKKDLLSQNDMLKKLSIPQRMQWMKGVYKNNNFSTFVQFAKEVLENNEKDHEFRQDVSSKRIKVTEEVLAAVEDETFDSLCEIPATWHQYLDPRVLEPIYDIIQANLVRKKLSLDKEEQELISKRDRSSLTTYLYDNNLDPYSLPEEKLSTLESTPDIISKIEFFKYVGIPVNNSLTIHYETLLNITEEQISMLKFLITSNVLSRSTLRDNLNVIVSNYQRIIDNYEILKNIIDFNNVFYKDTILLKDIKEIKGILSVLKEYKLSLNNYIFLLCNYEYLSLYDLLLEQDIEEELFISICKTENPLNTIKRIIIFKNIGEQYATPTNFLKKEVSSESKFICDDSSLDEYIPNIVEQNGLNIVNGTTISTIVNNDLVKYLDTTYRVDNTYIIGGTIISRPKFLRNFESVQANPNYLIFSLVSNSILDEKEYYDLTSTLRQNKSKK
ncbi:MAG: hypothetical protein E7171_03470 [Firmicutes bacterium]|nr:hypothetical protein [Bacillota bacterium]